MRQLTLLTRPGCHLCDDARTVVLAATRDAGWAMIELNVADDDELRAEFGDMVPVVLVNGVMHGYFHVDPIRLRKALV